MRRNIIRLVISTTVLMLIAAGLAVFFAVLSVLIGILSAQRGQRAVYYAMRRQAQQQASQRYLFAFWCVVLAGVLFGISRFLPSDAVTEDVNPLPTAAPIAETNSLATSSTAQADLLPAKPALSPTVETILALTPLTIEVTGEVAALPTPTLAVMAVETTTQTAPQVAPNLAPVPTETLPITPTRVAAPTLGPESTAIAPGDPVTIVIAPNQQLALRAIGTGWDASGALQGVSTEFEVGTQTIYVFFNYLDVPRGTLLRHTWLQDGKTVSFSSETFSELGRGTQAISWAPKGGFQPGLYEVRVDLGSMPQFVANFLVR